MFPRTLVLIAASIVLMGQNTANAGDSDFSSPAWTQKQERYVEVLTPEESFFGNSANQNHRSDSSSFRQNSKFPTSPLSKAQSFGAPQRQEKPEPSAIEKMYSARAEQELKQFGYDMFGVPAPETRNTLARLDNSTQPMGAVQDNFILNSGDEIEVIFTGQRNSRDLYTVNTRGQILIEDFPPIPAAGRSIGQVRLSIEAAAHNMHNTNAYVSLSSVRQIGVLVIGHVHKPGRQTLTVFNTVLDALIQAGGVQKTGSLRQIRLVRDGKSHHIDLYGILVKEGDVPDLNLRDGDRIVIPALGPTVAIAGEAKRPGIFEIRTTYSNNPAQAGQTSEHLSLNTMLDFSGGVLTTGQNRFLKFEITSDGKEQITEIHNPQDPSFADGAILMISSGTAKRAGMIELQGHSRRAGLHALTENQSLSALLSSPNSLDEDIYPLLGLIKRWDKEQLTHQLIGFPLRLALHGGYDLALHEGDAVHLFSNAQISALFKTANDTDVKIEEEEIRSTQPTERSETSTPNANQTNNVQNTITDPAIASFLREHAVFLRGAVRFPGAYPIAEGTSLENLLAAAGGTTREANTSNVEIIAATAPDQTDIPAQNRRSSVDLRSTSPTTILISPGDAVRINQQQKQLENKSVLIMGEIAHPGHYDLMPGDKMSDLLQRAGGFTAQAYPEAAIFSRESERRAEEARFRAQARDIKNAIGAALQTDEQKINTAQIAEARALAAELENAKGVGRITAEANLAKLKIRPELDMLLEAGDRIFIPKRSLNVRVRGEVLSPASLQFRKEKTPSEYINQAGGFTYYADKDRTFVLYPDGSAEPLRVSSWNQKATFIPPGSTIVVPRDPKPFDFIESARDISQILSNLAITAIFIDDLRSD